MSLTKISDLFNFEKGSLQSTKCTPGEYSFITASSEWKTHNEYTHECEALIFAAAASGSLGRTHYVNGKFISSDLCFILTPKYPEKYPIDIKFYHLIFETFRDDIVKNTKAGTSKEAIGLKSFGKYKLPYFNIDKQISTREQFVNTQISKTGLVSEFSCQLNLVTQLRQAFLRESMQGKLTAKWREKNPDIEPASELLKKIKAKKEQLIKEKKIKKQKPLPPISEDEIPFEIPESWQWCKLGEISELITSGSRNWNKFYSKTGDLFIRSQNIKPDKLDLSNKVFVELPSKIEGKRTSVVENDILITITGAGVSNSAVLKNLNDSLAYVSQHVSLIRLIEKTCSEWIHLAIIAENVGKLQFAELIYGDKPGLNLNQINNLVVPLPQLPEQQQIVTKLNELMQYCDKLEESIKNSQQQNEMLLQQVLREALEPKGDEI